MWPDRVSNPGPLTYESGALPTALRGPASSLLSDMGLHRVLRLFCPNTYGHLVLMIATPDQQGVVGWCDGAG